MASINPETRTSVYFGITFVLARGWSADKGKTVDFQKNLLDNGLDFSQTNILGNSFLLSRTDPCNFTVKVESPTKQMSSVQIGTQNPQGDLEVFIQEVGAVVDAYQKSWPGQQYQLIRSVAKVQHLYSSTEHAFKYIWEERLGQSASDLASLGKRPVAGGGIRLVMPPYAEEGKEPNSIEVRIESFMQEPGKLLVETTSAWPKPVVINNSADFNVGGLLHELENYATDKVFAFLTQGK